MEQRMSRLEECINDIRKDRYASDLAVAKLEKNVESMGAHFDERIDYLTEAFQELKHALMGNGQPGRLSQIEARVTHSEQMLWKISGALALLMALSQVIPAIKSLMGK